MKQVMPTFASLLLFCIHFICSFAQSPLPAPIVAAPAPALPAPALPSPAPPAPATPAPSPPAPSIPGPIVQSSAPSPSTGPVDIIAILKKAGRFTTLIRLMKSTQSADRINTQLISSSQGLTIFAPDDGAFASLKAGSLNTYTAQQQSDLIQSHILPSHFSIAQFDTASNPLSTQAGGTNYGQFPLNVTTSGTAVNLTTGFANAAVVSTVYTDNKLAVYEVDHVLLPQRFFVAPPPSPPPAPAPAPPKPKKAQSSDSSAKPLTSSGAATLIHEALFPASCVFALLAASWIIG